MNDELKKAVYYANLAVREHKLTIYSWGNVSGFDRDKNIIAIKPSGITYDELTPEKIVLVDLEGNIVEGDLKPSSDTLTHLELYRSWPDLAGICHTHSNYATMWAQACREIPCFGTTHADYYYGPVPVTTSMTDEEITNDYELNTGKVIVRRFKKINPLEIPAVLVAHHGPFTWGRSPDEAVESAVVLEHLAESALGTITLNQNQPPITQTLLDKHYLRKHGKNAYYGQKDK